MSEWLRDGRLVYRLQHSHWRKGEEVLENRTTINCVGDEAEAMAFAVQKWLNGEVAHLEEGLALWQTEQKQECRKHRIEYVGTCPVCDGLKRLDESQTGGKEDA